MVVQRESQGQSLQLFSHASDGELSRDKQQCFSILLQAGKLPVSGQKKNHVRAGFLKKKSKTSGMCYPDCSKNRLNFSYQHLIFTFLSLSLIYLSLNLDLSPFMKPTAALLLLPEPGTWLLASSFVA